MAINKAKLNQLKKNAFHYWSKHKRLVIIVGASVIVGTYFLIRTFAWSIGDPKGLVKLDYGLGIAPCGNIKLDAGSDQNASRINTPSLILNGDGGASQYQIYLDGVDIGVFTTTYAPTVCIKGPNPLAEGTHTITGKELRPNPANSVIPYTFRVDTVVPISPTMTSIPQNQDTGIIGDNITRFTSISVVGKGEFDPLGSTSVVILDDTGYRVGSGIMASDKSFLVGIGLTAGVHNLTGYLYDPAANRSPNGPVFKVTVDTTPPTGSPTNLQASQPAPSSVKLSWDFGGSDNVEIWGYDVYKDGTKVQGATVAHPSVTGSTTKTYTFSSVTAGAHTYKVVPVDIAGNVGTASTTITFNSGANTSSTVSFEPEKAALSGGAVLISDSNASGGQAIKFQ